MDFGILLIFLVMFGLISIVVEKLTGFNPYKVYLIAGAIGLFFSFIYILFPVMFKPYDIELALDRFTIWLINGLPGALIGDYAGIIISKIKG